MKGEKDAFDEVEVDAIDAAEVDDFDIADLDPEDKVLYSKELKELIRKEVIAGVLLAKKALEEKFSKKLKSVDDAIPVVDEKLEKTSEELKTEITSVEEKTKKLDERIDKLTESHDVTRNSLLAVQTPQYQFGGFAPPNPTSGAAGTFLKNTDQTWAGLQWGSVGTGLNIPGADPNSVLFVDASSNLDTYAHFTFTDDYNLTIGSGTKSGSSWIGNIPTLSLLSSTGSQGAYFDPFTLQFDPDGFGQINNVGGIQLPNFTEGSVLYIDSNKEVAEDNSGFFYDAATHSLGIGGVFLPPNDRLSVGGGIRMVSDSPGLTFCTATDDASTFGWSRALISAVSVGGGIITSAYDLVFYNSAADTFFPLEKLRVKSTGKVGIGTGSTVSAYLHVLGTTEQLRIGYDTSNYYSTTVGSTGVVTLDAVGSGASFVFTDPVSVGTTASTKIYLSPGGTFQIGQPFLSSAGQGIQFDYFGGAIFQGDAGYMAGESSAGTLTWEIDNVDGYAFFAGGQIVLNASGSATFGGDVTVPDEAYGSGWNGSLEVPTKNAVYDKIQTLAPFAKRVVSVSDATSISPNADTTDILTQANTQAAGTLTMNAPSGSPVAGQAMVMRIKSTNVQTFSWNAIYRGSNSTPLPGTSSGSTLTDYYCFIYNFTDTKWDFTGMNQGYT